MIFLSGEAGKVSGSKFQKEINGKSFSYRGESEFGVFIEEIVFRALANHNPSFKSELLQIIVIMTDTIFFVTLNDSDNGYAGENTLEYSRTEFKTSEIMGYLSDNIFSKTDLIFVNYDEETKIFNYSRDKDSLDFNVNFNDIEIETMISGSKRFKTFFLKNIHFISFMSLSILIPLLTFTPISSKIDLYELEVKKLDIQEKKLQIQKQKKDTELLDTTRKYASIENTKDLFSNEALLQKVMDLKVISSVPITPKSMVGEKDNSIPSIKSIKVSNNKDLKSIQQLSEEEKYKDVPLPELPTK